MSRVFAWTSGAVLVACLPVAVLAFTLPPNRYVAQEITGAVDCDGPLKVMIFAVPALLLYGAGALAFAIAAARLHLRWPAAVVAFCLAVATAISLNVARARREHWSLGHIQTCGPGW